MANGYYDDINGDELQTVSDEPHRVAVLSSKFSEKALYLSVLYCTV